MRNLGPLNGVMETALSSHHFTAFADLVRSNFKQQGVVLQPGHARLQEEAELTPETCRRFAVAPV